MGGRGLCLSCACPVPALVLLLLLLLPVEMQRGVGPSAVWRRDLQVDDAPMPLFHMGPLLWRLVPRTR